MEKKSLWSTYTKKQLKEVETLSVAYRAYLDAGKTERECVQETLRQAQANGYRELQAAVAAGPLHCGDKLYAVGMDKSVVLFNIGSRPLEQGMTILGAHIDSPRLDVKQNPLYEETGSVYLDTHYYGGVKKYHWVALPLAIHGVFVKKDGTVVPVSIGEQPDDPVFCITDLLIHLSQDQLEKKARKVVEGEDLDVLFGSMPLDKAEKDAAKQNVLKLLADRYGVEEDDFLSAELEVVPAGAARDCGLDRSLILAYGQDDRVCAYTSLAAMLAVEQTERTTCCFLCDKEEIGSVGATGARSRFFENSVAELLAGLGDYSELALRRCLASSHMLSSDVSAIFDPLYPAVFDKRNAAYLAHGPVFNKFTGSGGKSGSNDANPEFFARIRRILDEAKVGYQTAELGKVDQGGGGTIAYIFALYGMDVIDSGVGVLSMHAPWETTSKADVYEAKRCYEAFLRGF